VNALRFTRRKISFPESPGDYDHAPGKFNGMIQQMQVGYAN
jgi:hypothetical protein